MSLSKPAYTAARDGMLALFDFLVPKLGQRVGWLPGGQRFPRKHTNNEGENEVKQQKSSQITKRQNNGSTLSSSARVSLLTAASRKRGFFCGVLLIVFVFFPALSANAESNILAKSEIQVSSVTNSMSSSSLFNYGWIKDKVGEALSPSAEPGAFTQNAVAIAVWIVSILGVLLRWLFKINIFAPIIWFIGLFNDKLRLRRFMIAFKGRKVKCDPYISIERPCLYDFKRIVKDGTILPGVFFFYGQRDVGKKVVLVGECGRKDVSVVQIPEDKWLKKESNLVCEDLINALETVFPPIKIGHPRRLVLVLDCQIKDYQAFRDILEHVRDSLYLKLSTRVRERISIVVKMIGMYAARDIRDIHPVMIDPLSANECVAFSNEYLKRKSRQSGDAVMDEHVLFVNSMGHPSRLINYLEGNSDDDKSCPDVKVLRDWTESFGANADESLRKAFYCLIYILSIVSGHINLNRLIELVTQQGAESKAFISLKKAILLIVGSRTNFDIELFDTGIVFENLEQERHLIAWRAGHYGDDSQCHFADVLPATLARCATILSSSSIILYGEDFCRRMMATCVSNWTDIPKCVPRLIRMFERLENIRIQHSIGMRLIVAAYRFELYPRYGIAENEEIAEQIRIMLDTLQEMRWSGWLDALLTFAPLLCMVDVDISNQYMSEKFVDDCLGLFAANTNLFENSHDHVACILTALYCYALTASSKLLGISGIHRVPVVRGFKKYRSLRKQVWNNLNKDQRRFVACLRWMLAYGRITELDTDAYHGIFSDKRRDAIRLFLKTALEMNEHEFFDVAQVALQEQKFNLFLDDKNGSIISELIETWKGVRFEWDEPKMAFLWTLQWYKACSEETDCERPEDVLAVIDKVIEELDVSGNKCISGNPQTIVDMMWFASTKWNAFWGLKECSNGVYLLQKRMMEELKRWCPVLCFRSRLQMLSYFSRIVDRIHLEEEDVLWLVAELRKISSWATVDKLLEDRDLLYDKLLSISTALLGAMKGMNAFVNDRKNVGDLQSLRDLVLNASLKETALPVLRNHAAIVSWLCQNGELSAALEHLGLREYSDPQSVLIAISPNRYPIVFTRTAAFVFGVITDELRDKYEKMWQDHEQTDAFRIEQLSDLCLTIGLSLLQKINSPLCSVLTNSLAVDQTGIHFDLHKYRQNLEVAIVELLVVSRHGHVEDATLLRKLTTALLKQLCDDGKVLEMVRLCSFLVTNYPAVLDGDAFEMVRRCVKDYCSADLPKSLSGKRRTFETVFGILSNEEFLIHLNMEDVAKLLQTWKTTRNALVRESTDEDFPRVMNILFLSGEVQQRMLQIGENEQNQEWSGKSNNGLVRVLVKDDEATIVCRENDMEPMLFLSDVKQAFNTAISAKHEWRNSQLSAMLGEIGGDDNRLSFPEGFAFTNPGSLWTL